MSEKVDHPDVIWARENGAPSDVVALIKALVEQRQAIGRLRQTVTGSSKRRADEAIQRIENEIDSWTRDLGFGWGLVLNTGKTT